MCQVSHIICHLSLTPTATATDPPFANSPICIVVWLANTKKSSKQQQQQKTFRDVPILEKRGGLLILEN